MAPRTDGSRPGTLVFLIWSVVLSAPASAGKLARPIRLSDLKPGMKATTLASLRKKAPEISDEAFRAKTEFALKSPLQLKQTFPRILGTLLKPLVGTGALPGKESVVGFDAHIENAGRVRLPKNAKGRARTIETLIDLDDSGIGPAGVDAISVGVALEQAGFAPKVLKKAYEEFGRQAAHGGAGPEKAKDPNFGKIRKAWLDSHTAAEERNGEQVLSFKGRDRALPTDYAALQKAAASNPIFKDFEILDIAINDKEGGGSGGVPRFIALTKNEQTGRIGVFKVKLQATPGAAELGLNQPDNGNRLTVIEEGLWKNVPKDVFFYLRNVEFRGKTVDFLVSDKFAIVGESGTGKDKDETAILVAGLYGREHAGQFGKMTAPQIAHWMEASSHSVAKGYEELRVNLAQEHAAAKP